jgi:hypothetical protein
MKKPLERERERERETDICYESEKYLNETKCSIVNLLLLSFGRDNQFTILHS